MAAQAPNEHGVIAGRFLIKHHTTKCFGAWDQPNKRGSNYGDSSSQPGTKLKLSCPVLSSDMSPQSDCGGLELDKGAWPP